MNTDLQPPPPPPPAAVAHCPRLVYGLNRVSPVLSASPSAGSSSSSSSVGVSVSGPRSSPSSLLRASPHSRDMIMDGDELRDRVALLVLDMQETFRGVAEPLLTNLIPLIQVCSSPDNADASVVIFTQHGHAARSEGGADDGELGRWWGADNLIRKNIHEWKLMKEMQPYARTVVHKTHYDAFHDTRLDALLSAAGVSTVMISGVLTNLCCESTARSAFMRDYHVLFLSDGTAARTRQMQEATELNLSYGFCEVITCADAVRRVQERQHQIVSDETSMDHHDKGMEESKERMRIEEKSIT